MYFRELHQRLIDVARERVRAGEFTVRGLARIAGMSQPHMQNALKGIRSLSPDAADRLMRALSLSIPDPNWLDSGLSAPTIGVPLLRSRIGPGIDTDFSVFRGHVDFDSALVGDLVNPLAVRLAADLALPRIFSAGDLLLLDQNPAVRERPGPRSCWVVAASTGLGVRYLRTSEGLLQAASQPRPRDPRKWRTIPLRRGNILEIVRARVVWFGHEMEKEPAGPSEPAGSSD